MPVNIYKRQCLLANLGEHLSVLRKVSLTIRMIRKFYSVRRDLAVLGQSNIRNRYTRIEWYNGSNAFAGGKIRKVNEKGAIRLKDNVEYFKVVIPIKYSKDKSFSL